MQIPGGLSSAALNPQGVHPIFWNPSLQLQLPALPFSFLEAPLSCQVLLEPGPLYNKALAEATWQEAVSKHNASRAKDLLCAVCGYPNCDCPKCCHKPGGHSCWLGGGAKGKGKRKNVNRAMTQIESDQLQAAWGALGLQAPVKLDGSWVFTST